MRLCEGPGSHEISVFYIHLGQPPGEPRSLYLSRRRQPKSCDCEPHFPAPCPAPGHGEQFLGHGLSS